MRGRSRPRSWLPRRPTISSVACLFPPVRAGDYSRTGWLRNPLLKELPESAGSTPERSLRPSAKRRAPLPTAHGCAPPFSEERRARLRRPAAARRCRAGRRRGRAAGAGRAQRLGQIDAAEDHGAGWSSPTAASASCARARPFAICRRSPTSPASRPRSPMSRPGWRRATTTIARSICSKQLGLTGDEEPSRLSGGEARRAALARVLAPRAGHPDPRRADQPPRPSRHRVAGGRAVEHPLGDRAGQPRPALAGRRCRAPRCGSTAGRSAGSTAAFGTSRAWRDEMFEQEERDRQKLDRKIAAELDWLRYGVTARRTRNQGRLRALNEHAPRAARAASRHRQGEVHRQRREDVRQAGDRGRTASRRRFGGRDADPRSLDPHRAAATGSASSARTAPARRRWSRS